MLPLELAVIEACEFGDGEPEGTEKVVEESAPVEEPKVKTEQKVAAELVEIAAETIVENPKNAEKPVRTSSKNSVKIEELQKNWSAILQKVRSQNNSLGVFLRNAKPTEIEDGLLSLEVYFQFHKDLVEEPKNSRLIAAMIEETLGKPVRIVGKVGVRPEKPEKAKVEEVEEADPSELFGKLN